MDGGKVGYRICEAQGKIKMQEPLFEKEQKRFFFSFVVSPLTSHGVLKFVLNVTLPQHGNTRGGTQTLTGNTLGPTCD